MPVAWHDWHAANKIKPEEDRIFYRSIAAGRKPYFMRYIYPNLMKRYNTYIKNTERNANRNFQMTVPEMKKLPYGDLSEEQRDFLRRYDHYLPAGIGGCVMNRICRRFEREFDGYIGKHGSDVRFDYTIMKSETDYSAQQFAAIKKLYEDFNKRTRSYAVFAYYERVGKYDSSAEMSVMSNEFRRRCDAICPDGDKLCNIVLDLCYTRGSSKMFAWSVCGSDIIHNLLKKNDCTVSFPVHDRGGDVEYCGDRFSVLSKKIGENA
jgi:hypothetical protein